MAQIIKHRRGSITQLKDVTARISELVVATGSIGDLNGPFLFVGETEGVAGAYRSVSKIYQGATAPTITVGSHGSVVDGTPFYASGNKSLYILSKDGNARLDFTGNIEGNTISNVTITSLTGSNLNVTNITGSTVSGSNVNVSNTLTVGGATTVNNNLTVTGTTNVGTNLNVTGNTILNGSVTVTGLTNNRLVLVGTGGLLEDSIDLTFDGNKFDIGQGQFQVDTTTGDIRTSGSIVMKGNITIGDQNTDNIILAGEVSSSIIPDVHNAFDLGSSTQNWRNLHVSGTAYVNILEAQSISLDGITVFEDLVVSGSSYLGTGGGDEVIISGSVYNDQLTNNRVVIVGAQGLLEDDANFTFDGTELNIGQGDFTVQQSSGNVDTAGTLNVGGATTLESTLTVTGSTTLKDNLSVSGTTTVSGSTILQDTLQVNSTSELRGAVGINSTLDVTGSAKLKSTLEVVGNTSLNGTLTVTGSATLKNNLSVSGTTTVSGTTILQDTLTVFSTSELRGAVGLNSTLDVTGSAQFKSTINVDSEATLASATVEDLTQDRIVTVGAGGSLIDNSGFTYNGTVFQIGGGQFEVDNSDGDVRTSGSLTTNGLTNNGDLTVNGVLTVTGNTQLQSNLYVSGNLEVLGSATNVIIQSQTIELDDNIIRLNAYSPFERYAGFEVMDSGSSGVSASMVWDSLSDYWMFVSSSGQSSKMIGTTAGTYGSENSLTATYFPIATGPNTIGDSLLRYSGTTLSFNTNKFTIDSGTGDTAVSGNFTLSYSGGTDNGTKTSAIMFRNSSNVVGFVSTTESEDVLDGILGYKNSDGTLKFSTVIDGGTY
jgi:predicted acyltransferase (DUF342 family)